MAQREGSVYLYLFIVACVLFMIMTVLFFIDNSDKQTQVQRADDLDRKNKTFEGELRQLADANTKLKVLIAGPSAATDQWPGEDNYMTLMKEKAEAAINEVLESQKESKRTYDCLIGPYADLQGLYKKLIQARDEAFAARAAAVDAKAKAEEAANATVAELRKKGDENLQAVQECQTKLEDLDNKSKQEKAELVKKAEEERDQRSDEIIALKRQINFKENTIKALNTRIDKLQEESRIEKEFDEVEPDGKIVNLLASSGKGWVDLGRQDHLRNGLVFRVFQYVKGGKKVFKGRVEVQKVDEDTSEVRVIEEADGLNPIIAGDFISSPFYDPKAQPVFVFAGTELESKDVTKEYVVSKMKSYGARIGDKVDINTEFLVALKNYENTSEYKTARELGVTVIRERNLLEFIGR